MTGRMRYFGRIALLCALAVTPAFAADCRFVVVASGNTCDSISRANNITVAQLQSFNPGLNCAALAIDQKLCISAGSLPGQPHTNPDGSCATYTAVSGDYCAAIAAKFSISVDNIELWNKNTYKWKGCAGLQVGFTLCVSAGTPPPIPIDPNAQCGPTSKGNATCPLKACCSAFGYCGFTDDFCTTSGANPCQSNCGTTTLPSCSTTPSRQLAYYAGWAARRVCTPFAPSQLDLRGITHVNFAFAGIGQDMTISIAGNDAALLRELVGLKASNSGLKVLIALGGWAFSEDTPTRDLFSVMISTSANRSKFIKSVKDFLTSYGLDGIDIDFEYPAAIERNAPATDTPNLTAFFSELRAGIPNTLISAATPAGYWFLRGFEIDKIINSVNWLNMMSYDYHGPWDTNITGQAPVASPHTSLLDIQDSAKLYVRAGINLNKVNLGLAWYGRTYHLSNAACTGYSCTMTGGGAAGSCTQASGILAQFEVLSKLGSGTATLDSASQTYWFTNGGDLITFDQLDTWNAKKNFAGRTCFGGTFVWSLDQVQPTKAATPPTTTTTPPTSTTYPAPTGCPSLKAIAKAQADKLMENFVPYVCNQPQQPPVGTCAGGFWTDHSDPQLTRMWTDFVAMETMYNYIWATGDTQWENLINKQSEIRSDDPPFGGGLGGDGNQPFNKEFSSYDDGGWAGLTYMKVAQYNGAHGRNRQYYINSAKAIHSWLKPHYNTTCGGGVPQKAGASNPSTITSELFFYLSVVIALETGESDYNNWAMTTGNWFLTGAGKNLLGSDGLWWDSLDLNCVNGNVPKYSYNSGVILSSFGMMYKLTGDVKWRDAGLKTLDGVVNGGGSPNDLTLVNGILKENSDDVAGCTHFCGNQVDQNVFKGIFIKHVQYFLDAVNDNAITYKYGDFIGAQASGIIHFATGADGVAGTCWYAPNKGGSQFNVKSKQAALDGLLAALKYARC